jgi:ABC-type polysaccharide/polyol phosphate transport system ATPase subunit
VIKVVEIEGVWKRFPMTNSRLGLKEFVLGLPGLLSRKRDSYFWALKDVSFSVAKGECLGIIGRNGSGKSTLLSLLLGTMYPTLGNVSVSQRVTPLLALGAGFHPELTGRENILLNGVLLGLTRREVEEQSADIISFAEIARFIDMPVRTYSSGMSLRLGFSVAIHTKPQLLLIDEILAVGDEAFRKKSEAALVELIKGGLTTILVSHRLATVREICDRAIWIDEGRIMADGDPKAVTQEYTRSSARP